MEDRRSPLLGRFAAKLLPVLLLAGPAMGQGEPEQARAKITKLGILLSKETTYILGPVNEDGTVNYYSGHNL